jgi:hypothetical protein
LTRRDNRTRWRAKGLWTDVPRSFAIAPTEPQGSIKGSPQGPRSRVAWAVAAYKAEAQGKVDCIDPKASTAKVAADSQFEAVLGKTHRTEF